MGGEAYDQLGQGMASHCRTTHDCHQTAETQGPSDATGLGVMLLDEASSSRGFAIDPFEDKRSNNRDLI
jgi:hypothetical protein